jgi:serine phosphatase RsbU (regulator of sigma subunit)
VDSIIAQARVTSFVTGLVGQVDLAERELQLVIAGHHPPSILIGGKPVQVPEDCQTRPWGLDFESDWQVGRIPLGERDWSVLCFTDGIIDAIVHPQKTFGAKGVAEYHRENHRLSGEDLCEGLLNAVAQQSHSLSDDQTVLVLCSSKRRRPRSGEPSTAH